MKHYSKYGFKNFYIALGYKGHVIRKYFSKKFFDWNVNLIETGKNTMTGGRLKRLKKILSKERFMLTYGDGLSNVNINKLLDLHKKNKKTVTLTAVRPPARFGALKIIGTNVKYFKEKSKLDEGWINGGYFVIEPDFLKNIKGDKTYLEKEPLENLAKKKQLELINIIDGNVWILREIEIFLTKFKKKKIFLKKNINCWWLRIYWISLSKKMFRS